MTDQQYQVFGLGQCSLDSIGEVSSYPGPDEKCELQELLVQGGGPVATALVALSRWGVSTTFTGVLGDDEAGRHILSSLKDEGVDTAGALIRAGSESQIAFIAAEPGAGRRTVFWRRPTGTPLKSGEVDFDRLRNSQLLHTDGLFGEASLAACKAAREAGIPVVVDAGSLREGMIEHARNSDYFIASESFARDLVGKENAIEACRRLSELGPRLTGVTLGSRGYVAMIGDEEIQRPAHRVDSVDTTGCGDVFHAGFIYGLIRSWSPEKCLEFGSWAAAMVSLRLGGRSGIPSPDEVEEWEQSLDRDRKD